QTFLVSSGKEYIEAKLTITASTLQNNTSGGGIYAGDLTLARSTLSSNGQTGVAGIMYITDSVLTGHEVAAVSLDGGDRSIISNSTIADNPGQGITGFGKITVANSTIAANLGGGANVGQFFMDDNLIISSTIIAGNTYEGNADIAGTVVSLGNNLVGDPGTTTGWFSSDLLGVDPLLAPLGDYGGPTQTMALFDGSPVIGAGYCLGDQTAPGVTADQRGVKRKDSCDIGAYETEPGTSLPAVVPTSAPTQKATLAATSTPTESSEVPTAGVPAIPFTATAPAIVFTATANQGINVRSGPGLEYNPPIGSLAAGQSAVVLAINPKGDWYKIQYYDGEGWVGRMYVTTQGDISGLPVDHGNGASLNSDTKPAAIVLQENCILHTLQANDTPASLASLYGADSFRILEVNGLTAETSTLLKVGDELLIPQEGCSLTMYQRPS
ncbi:MAG: SH3 domain-containing protein, partial [Anaerolineae bacterium]|nr:SH3 domain-containing protein [Anaerolineae bacterium]